MALSGISGLLLPLLQPFSICSYEIRKKETLFWLGMLLLYSTLLFHVCRVWIYRDLRKGGIGGHRCLAGIGKRSLVSLLYFAVCSEYRSRLKKS